MKISAIEYHKCLSEPFSKVNNNKDYLSGLKNAGDTTYTMQLSLVLAFTLKFLLTWLQVRLETK